MVLRDGGNSLFSAHAEVFPSRVFPALFLRTLLRTRGGISYRPRFACFIASSSPHTRRYFPRPTLYHVPGCLFSAHAEVFPDLGSQHWRAQPLLRTRGGMS